MKLSARTIARLIPQSFKSSHLATSQRATSQLGPHARSASECLADEQPTNALAASAGSSQNAVLLAAPARKPLRLRNAWKRMLARSLDRLREKPRTKRERSSLSYRGISGIERCETRLVPAVFTPTVQAVDGIADTLRAAIIQANANGQDDVIVLSAGRWKINVSNEGLQENAAVRGDLDLTEVGKTIVIQGAGQGVTFIEGNGADRLFQVMPGVKAIFRDLSLTDGLARDDGFDQSQPTHRIGAGGAILMTNADVELERVELRRNRAQGAVGLSGIDGRRAQGGAIWVTGGTLKIRDSNFHTNFAIGGDGGNGTSGRNGTEGGLGTDNDGEQGDDGGNGGNANGGVIYGFQTVITISGSTFNDNTAQGGKGGDGGDGGSGATGGDGGLAGSGAEGGTAQGGVIYIDSSNLSVSSSSFEENQAIGGNSGRGGRGGDGGGGGSGNGLRGSPGGPSNMGGRALGGALALAISTTTITGSSVLHNQALGGQGENGGLGGKGGDSSGGLGGNGGQGGTGGDGGFAWGGGVMTLRGSVIVNDSTIAHSVTRGGLGGIGGPGGTAGSGPSGGNGGNGGLGGSGGDALGGGLFLNEAPGLTTNATYSNNSTTPGIGGPGGDEGTPSANGSSGREGTGGRKGNSQGGGVFFESSASGSLLNVTIAQNSAFQGEGDGLFNAGSNTVAAMNTLIAENNDEDVVGRFTGGSAFNLIGTATRIAGITNGTNGNRIGTGTTVIPALLGPLGNNGGPTQTHLPREGSPAIDTGSPTGTPAFDQRGRMRPLQSPSDIGAVEAQRILTLQLPDGGGVYRLKAEGSDLVVKNAAGAEFFRFEFAALFSLTINGSNGVDDLTADFSAGDVLPVGGLRFKAVANAGALFTAVGTSTSHISYALSPTPGHLGMKLDEEVISLENVLPVTDLLGAATRTLTFGENADTATLGDDPATGISKLTVGAASLFFQNPTTQLQVNAGPGDDSISLTPLDPGFTGTLGVDGQSGNDILNASAMGHGVRLVGGIGHDQLTGTLFNDQLEGGDGNDTLLGGSGDDLLIGATGNDLVIGDVGNDSMQGDDGQDSLYGGLGADTINGGSGNDIVSGQTGSGDLLSGGLGDDTITGGTGVDILSEAGDVNFVLTAVRLTGLGTDTLMELELLRLTGGASNNLLDARGLSGIAVTLDGGLGNDTLYGSAGADQLIGSTGDDLLIGGDGNDALNGGAGRDSLEGGLGNDVLDGQSENDTLNGQDGDDTLVGGDHVDLLDGGVGNDNLNGGTGNDTALGGDGDDVVDGGDGTDSIDGGSGNDLLAGGASNDRIDGGLGNDTVNAGAGNDRVFGDAGADVLNGGDGTDDLYGGLDNDSLNGDSGNDLLFGNEGNDALNGGLGDDLMLGDAGNDGLFGDFGNDTLLGGDGVDIMSGGNDRDLMLGGDGDDALSGQQGTDTLSGGSGINNLINPGNADAIDETSRVVGSFEATSGTLTILVPAGPTMLLQNKFGRVDVTLGGVLFDPLRAIAADSVVRLIVRGSSGHDSIDLTLVETESFRNLTGDVLVMGEAGNDSIKGSAFGDSILGGDGDDTIRGGKSSDTLLAGAGNDRVYGEVGEDILNGDDGNDWLDGGDGADQIDGGTGDDTLRGRSGNDLLIGGLGNDGIIGHRGNDTISGAEGNDTLLGGDDNDLLLGGSGNDTVLGGFGADYVRGHSGTDKLAGGHGYGRNDLGDVLVADLPSEIDEFFTFSAAWLEDTDL